MIGERHLLIAAGCGLGLLALYMWIRGPAAVGKDAGGVVVDLAGGVVAGVAGGVGQVVGVPLTNSDKARALMDAYASAPWYEQATMAFQVAAYASASDYLKWVADKSHRPAPGAY